MDLYIKENLKTIKRMELEKLLFLVNYRLYLNLDGEKYQGMFVNDKFEGEGTYTYK